MDDGAAGTGATRARDRLWQQSQVEERTRETYLAGAVMTPNRESSLVLELDDVSWTRSALPGEGTYSLTIMRVSDHTRVE